MSSRYHFGLLKGRDGAASMMDMAQVRQHREWLSVRVAARREEARDIFSYELTDPQGGSLPPFSAGSHIDVEVGQEIVRQYSLCNHPGERHRYLIAVLKEPDTRGGSLAMHERVVQGDTLRISEPKNHFPLVVSATKTLLFAGGIGVTPILCMAEQLAKIGADFHMWYCARSRDRMAFAERIRRSPFAHRVSLHLDDGPEAHKLDIRSVLAHTHADTHLYVCGPNGFMEWVLDAARRHDWPDAQIHREYFSAPVQSAKAAGAFEVQISSNGTSFMIPADKTIVQVLAENGVDIPICCERGVCGTCLTRVIDGEPDHADAFLSEEEKARNDCMTPCCSRAKSRKLVLDL